MEVHRLYSDDLTETERVLGFIKAFVNNPDAQYCGHGSIVPAVIYVLGKGSRIIKLNEGAGYLHQVFGSYGSSEFPDWKPILHPFPSAEQAIDAAKSGVYQTDPLAQTLHFARDRLSISLRCPTCSHEFESNDDHLPIDGTQSCSSCGKEDQTEAFSSYNL